MPVRILPCLLLMAAALGACATNEARVVEENPASITLCARSAFALLAGESIASKHCAASGQIAEPVGAIQETCSHTAFFENHGYMQEYQCVAPPAP